MVRRGGAPGGGGYVRPNDPITRQETAVILERALALSAAGSGRDFPDGDQIAAWAGGAVDTLSSLGLLTGGDGGAFQPLRSITRAETAALLDRAVAGYYDAAGVYTESQSGAVTLIAAPGVTLRDVTITGDLLITPGAGGSDTILSNVTVTGATRVLSGKDNQVLALGGSSLGEVTVSGDGARLKLEDGAAAESVTVTGGGVRHRHRRRGPHPGPGGGPAGHRGRRDRHLHRHRRPGSGDRAGGQALRRRRGRPDPARRAGDPG